MSEVTDDGVPTPADIAARVTPRTFTQADVDRLVKARLAQARHVAEDSRRTSESTEPVQVLVQGDDALAAMRTRIAAEHGVPDDVRDELMTATDEQTLTAQAARLSELRVGRPPLGNVAPREGSTRVEGTAPDDREMREFVADLFGDGSGDGGDWW